jgi:protoporphyrinogen oxidase
MERNVEFKNFVITKTKISAEMYCDGKYIMELRGKIKELQQEEDSPIALYKYFKHAVRTYLKIVANHPIGGGNDTIH